VLLFFGNDQREFRVPFEVSPTGRPCLSNKEVISKMYESAGMLEVPSELFYFDTNQLGVRVPVSPHDSMDLLLLKSVRYFIFPAASKGYLIRTYFLLISSISFPFLERMALSF
jgi:hypothetical protein